MHGARRRQRGLTMREPAAVALTAVLAAEILQIRHIVGAVLRYARGVRAQRHSRHPAA